MVKKEFLVIKNKDSAAYLFWCIKLVSLEDFGNKQEKKKSKDVKWGREDNFCNKHQNMKMLQGSQQILANRMTTNLPSVSSHFNIKMPL